MSFDLYVLKSGHPLTLDQAFKLHDELEDSHDPNLPIQPEIRAFCDELNKRFPFQPKSDREEDLELWRWSMAPSPSNASISLGISYSHAKELAPIIKRLARKHKLVFINPQARVICHPRWLEEPTELHFKLDDGSLIVLPSEADCRTIVGHVQSGKNEFAILQRDNTTYMQTILNDDGPAFILEYRDGSADRHFRAENVSAPNVIQALVEYAQGDNTWHARHTWNKLDFS